jgi:poly(3-hydroxyalkanoate) depolymerase
MPPDGYKLTIIHQFVRCEIGVSDWLTVDQERINQFAACTGDHQWIHVDVERAKRESPFGTPIAHHWRDWLRARSGEQRPAPQTLGNARYAPGAPAPGTYVRDERMLRHPNLSSEKGPSMQPPTGQPLGTRTITVKDQRLRIAIRPGNGTRPPLLVMNGLGANLGLLQPFVEVVDPAIEVVCFDVPGVGGSPPPSIPYRFATLAWLVAQMLDHLGYTEVDVLGISWGGGLAQQFAVQHRTRCRRLVLVSTATGALMVPGSPAVLAKLATPRRYLDPDYLARVAPELYGGSMRSHPEQVRELVQATHAVGLRGYLYQLLASIGWTSLPWLALIRQPTLILAGDDDPIVPLINAKLMQRLIPDARLRVFRDGHLGLLTQARELAPVVAQFLSEEPQPGSSRPRSTGSPGRLWRIVVLFWQNLTHRLTRLQQRRTR